MVEPTPIIAETKPGQTLSLLVDDYGHMLLLAQINANHECAGFDCRQFLC
jgi:hypothetical protein